MNNVKQECLIARLHAEAGLNWHCVFDCILKVNRGRVCGQSGGDVGFWGRLYACCGSVLCLLRSVCLCCLSLSKKTKLKE